MDNLKSSSTPPITLAPPEISRRIPRWDGLSLCAPAASGDGFTNSIQESLIGTNGLKETFTHLVLSEINSGIESYISTELIPYLQTLSHGDRNLLWQKYALEGRCNSDAHSLGSRFSFKFTIALYSRSPHTDGEKVLFSIPLTNISECPSPIRTL